MYIEIDTYAYTESAPIHQERADKEYENQQSCVFPAHTDEQIIQWPEKITTVFFNHLQLLSCYRIIGIVWFERHQNHLVHSS